ncbi:MAG: hypothetical protein L6Q97_17385 [Thermoanaerobaculia bacterium]|nr:hypothetical protein [Thermoanaerobaculia bacterium]
MKLRRSHSTTTPAPGKSGAFLSKTGEGEGATPFVAPAIAKKPADEKDKKTATAPLTWAQRLQQANAIADARDKVNAWANLVAAALGPGFTVVQRTGIAGVNRDNCNFYIARGPGGQIVNFDANQLEAAKTYYCNDGGGQLSARVVLGKAALHALGPEYTQMLNQQQQQLAAGMEARGWIDDQKQPDNNAKLQAALAAFIQFFFSLVSYDLKTATPRIASKFDSLFIAYQEAGEDDRASTYDSILAFYNVRISGDTGNTIRFRIWLQTVLNDSLLTKNPLALKLNELPGMQLKAGVNPARHLGL